MHAPKYIITLSYNTLGERGGGGQLHDASQTTHSWASLWQSCEAQKLLVQICQNKFPSGRTATSEYLHSTWPGGAACSSRVAATCLGAQVVAAAQMRQRRWRRRKQVLLAHRAEMHGKTLQTEPPQWLEVSATTRVPTHLVLHCGWTCGHYHWK